LSRRRIGETRQSRICENQREDQQAHWGFPVIDGLLGTGFRLSNSKQNHAAQE
jgi:hypothetical protein